MIDSLLQFFKEMHGMATVHLGMMELEGDGQCHFEPMYAISAPHHHRIVELTTVFIPVSRSKVVAIKEIIKGIL